MFAIGLLMAVSSLATPVFAASVRYAFAVNGLDFSLSTFRVMESGQLRHLGHRPMVKSVPFVLLDPSGQFVLVPSKTVSTISVFRLDAATGALTPVPGSPFAAKATSPFSLTFHPSGRFLYAAARYSGVGAYAFDVKTGEITPLPGSPFPAGERTRGISMHPSGKFLYASNGYSNSVSAYRIDTNTGGLMALPGSPYSAGDMGAIDYKLYGMEDVPAGAGGIPYDVTVDPQGRFAFVANWAAASVSVFRIDAKTGQLSAVEGSPFFTGFNPYRLAVHPTGRFLYVTQFSSSEIAVHAIDPQTGKLTVIDGSPFATGGVGPVAVNFTADGKQLYVPNYESNDISLFDVNGSNGRLHLREVVKTRSGPWYVAVGDKVSLDKKARVMLLLAQGEKGIGLLAGDGQKIHTNVKQRSDALAVANLPGGRFVYAINRAENSLTTFRLDLASGKLSALADGVVTTGKQPGAIAVDVNGWYLYVTNTGENSMTVYYLDPQTGRPKRAHKPLSIPAGKRPTSVVLDEAARYAFVLNASDNDVSVYSYMNSVTPLIFESRGAGSPFPLDGRPLSLAVDPTGRFAYVVSANEKAISAYRIHHQTGALSALPGSPFAAADVPLTVVAHPNGKWLYSVNKDLRVVSVYEIENELGALGTPQQAIQLPAAAKSLWFNDAGDSAYILSQDGLHILQCEVDQNNGQLTFVKERKFSSAITDVRIIE